MSDRLRILHVFSTFVPGGPQVRTARLLAALGSGYEHTVVAMDGRTSARALLPPGVRILDPPPRAGSLRTIRNMARRVAALEIDLLATYNWGAIDTVLAGRLFGGPPRLHHEDGFLPDEVRRFKLRRVWTRRFALRGIDLVVPSHTLFDIATERWHLNPRRVHRIPNGIRLEDFPPADGNPQRRRELHLPPGACVLGAVGHLRREKRPERLVEALSRLEPRFHLVLVGEGPERARVEETARRLGVVERVRLTGHRERVQDDYRAMDAFLLSSDTEQMPVALLEAMATGLPVVATAVGDVARILPSVQRPFLVPLAGPATSARLAAAVERLWNTPGRGELGRANRRRVAERYSFSGMVESYARLYAQVAKA